jgi:putative ABC transport system substrate-binding protein
MRRREFIGGLTGAAAWAFVARAQQPALPVIGILSGGSADLFAPLGTALDSGLNENGFVVGKNVLIESHWANGQFDRLPSLAAALISRQPAVIVTSTLPATLAAKAATTTIPIVFVVGEDPVKVGLVESFSRPGGNVTGITNLMNVLGAKRLELVSEAIPKATLVALLVNPNNPNAEPDTKDLQAAAVALGQRLHVFTAKTAPEIDMTFAAAVEQKVGALFVNIDPFFFSRREQFAVVAAHHGIPTIFPFREYVMAGGLLSYGASFASAWRQCGIYVANVLKGAKPADLPVLQPTKIELTINLKAAKALGLTLPDHLLRRADEVIE